MDNRNGQSHRRRYTSEDGSHRSRLYASLDALRYARDYVGSLAFGTMADAGPAETVMQAAETEHRAMQDMTGLSASDDISADHTRILGMAIAR